MAKFTLVINDNHLAAVLAEEGYDMEDARAQASVIKQIVVEGIEEIVGDSGPVEVAKEA